MRFSPFSFASLVSQLEGQLYAFGVGLGVYVGMVRSSLEEKHAWMRSNPRAAFAIAFLAVLGIQLLILFLASISKVWAWWGGIWHALVGLRSFVLERLAFQE
jgi:hypothetical protein